jgi:hypothetical protein
LDEQSAVGDHRRGPSHLNRGYADFLADRHRSDRGRMPILGPRPDPPAESTLIQRTGCISLSKSKTGAADRARPGKTQHEDPK